ncbi:MAG: twin-arginine translocation signal domain-containing protein [Verrucomicrobia bacterium]|nr:twin-arginine translocation signal domain-containing protein [Verrucomicrobiota bacterium]
MKSTHLDRDVSRRGFLRGAGLFGLGGVVAALSTQRSRGAASPKPPRQPATSAGGSVRIRP